MHMNSIILKLRPVISYDLAFIEPHFAWVCNIECSDEADSPNHFAHPTICMLSVLFIHLVTFLETVDGSLSVGSGGTLFNPIFTSFCGRQSETCKDAFHPFITQICAVSSVPGEPSQKPFRTLKRTDEVLDTSQDQLGSMRELWYQLISRFLKH